MRVPIRYAYCVHVNGINELDQKSFFYEDRIYTTKKKKEEEERPAFDIVKSDQSSITVAFLRARAMETRWREDARFVRRVPPQEFREKPYYAILNEKLDIDTRVYFAGASS